MKRLLFALCILGLGVAATRAADGDWVSIFITYGKKIMINGQMCRIVEDQHIDIAIPAPDSVF